MATRRWLQVLLGVLLLITLAVVALAASCAYLVKKQVDVRQVASPADFDREARAVLDRFKGVPALIEDSDTGPRLSSAALASRQKKAATGAPHPLTALHVVVFSPQENKLVRISLPFWLLRMSPDGTVDIKNDDVDLGKMRLSIDDLEAAGPGPLLLRKSGDSRVLAWTE
ncbi:hypothetical protein [Luteitalea sp.]|jgi:hypothetical protein|uniref:hypothetical protein n=1 Tax=Luteitalea sp. TaxID=2004800 RepID=UPI0037C7B6B0